MAESPWPPEPGYVYRYRVQHTWHTAMLDRIDAQDPMCVLHGFGNVSVQLQMIERPKGSKDACTLTPGDQKFTSE